MGIPNPHYLYCTYGFILDNNSNKQLKDNMITKKEYVEQQVEGAWEDYKYITQILRDYFTDEVKDMSDKEFKDHLVGLNWEIDE